MTQVKPVDEVTFPATFIDHEPYPEVWAIFSLTTATIVASKDSANGWKVSATPTSYQCDTYDEQAGLQDCDTPTTVSITVKPPINAAPGYYQVNHQVLPIAPPGSPPQAFEEQDDIYGAQIQVVEITDCEKACRGVKALMQSIGDDAASNAVDIMALASTAGAIALSLANANNASSTTVNSLAADVDTLADNIYANQLNLDSLNTALNAVLAPIDCAPEDTGCSEACTACSQGKDNLESWLDDLGEIATSLGDISQSQYDIKNVLNAAANGTQAQRDAAVATALTAQNSIHDSLLQLHTERLNLLESLATQADDLDCDCAV